jgi:hypothetical protein
MKTRGLAIIFSLLSSTVFTGSGVLAQYEYHYSYGNSRVVQQDQTGLSRPSDTYIGTGTLSKSAQGAVLQGPQVNPGLPRVNHGAYIGTPGDNLYGAHPILSPAEEQQERAQMLLQRQKRRMYIQPRSQPEEQKGFLYQPGENLRAGSGAYMTYPSSSSESGSRSGAAIYNPGSLDNTAPADAQPPKPSSRRY